MERSEFLTPGGYRFFYDDGLFPPGTDTFLLSSLPRLRPGARVCDLGCGTGLLGLLLLQRQPELSVTGIELQPAALALAEKTAAANGLQDRMTFLQGDLRDLSALPEPGRFDLAVCNPPYYPTAAGAAAPDRARAAARSELCCTLSEVCAAARRLLRWGGALCLVHKPERLTDLLCAMRDAGLEPKRLRLVEKTAGAAPSLVLAEGRRGGRPGLSVLPPLILQDAAGAPTAEVDAIYFRKQEDTP